MGANESPFKPFPEADVRSDLQALLAQPRKGGAMAATPFGGVSTARLHGFDTQDGPLLSGLAACPGALLAARTTVALRHAMIGATVLVLYEEGDRMRPIVVGVLQEGNGFSAPATPAVPAAPASAQVGVRVDDECLTLSAERKIVLQCGDASITLTRAGKVIIKGNYILSRSTGYNKIKGAAIDIN